MKNNNILLFIFIVIVVFLFCYNNDKLSLNSNKILSDNKPITNDKIDFINKRKINIIDNPRIIDKSKIIDKNNLIKPRNTNKKVVFKQEKYVREYNKFDGTLDDKIKVYDIDTNKKIS